MSLACCGCSAAAAGGGARRGESETSAEWRTSELAEVTAAVFRLHSRVEHVARPRGGSDEPGSHARAGKNPRATNPRNPPPPRSPNPHPPPSHRLHSSRINKPPSSTHHATPRLAAPRRDDTRQPNGWQAGSSELLMPLPLTPRPPAAAMLLPVCSAAPTCSPLCPVTSSVAHVVGAPALRRVEVSALRSYADPLVARPVPDRPLLADSSIVSPYSASPDDIVRGLAAGEVPSADATAAGDALCCGGVEPPTLTAVSDLAAATTADAAINDAAERALLDAPVPTTFPADASDAEAAFARLIDSLGKKIFQAEDALTEGYDKLRLSAYRSLGAWRKSVDGAVGGLTASVDATKKQAAGGVTDASGALQDKVAGAGAVAVDVLRKAIVAAEDSLGSAATSIGYYYGSTKSSLPPNVKDLLNSSEEKVSLVLKPIGGALQQVYVVVEGIEKNVGLDPSDPIVQLAVLLGGSTTIGLTYWLFAYGGYSGDLSPESTLELLRNDDKADLRVKDGIPDLRRAARSKYATAASPEIKGSVKRLLKGGRDVDDVLLAVIIRNLKLVKGDSKVIIMDANGSRSKAIARLLKKLGVQRPYLVKGGFQSWAKNLRVKELKPETALTVINEDAEEILEGIKPTPTLVLGSLLGLSAAAYALLGVLSLGLTIYLRFSTYEGSEDLEQDLKLLLSPLRVGAEAFSWAAKKLEPSKIGLATSPSTTAVQDRVLQAAAKHESQPSDAEADSLVSEAFTEPPE
uniref:Rhodanese domain-containing protein n=1 Tax=Oryza meridionalis TaxID=40149 RepID=A0A0E0CBJ5_9ORYZ